MFKKIILITLTCILLLSIMSCTKETTIDQSSESTNEPTASTPHISSYTGSVIVTNLPTPTDIITTVAPENLVISKRLLNTLNHTKDDNFISFCAFLEDDPTVRTNKKFTEQTGIDMNRKYRWNIDEEKLPIYDEILGHEQFLSLKSLVEDFYKTKFDSITNIKEMFNYIFPGGTKFNSGGDCYSCFNITMKKIDVIKLSYNNMVQRMVDPEELPDVPL